MQALRRTWAEISLDHLTHNYTVLRRGLPDGCRFLGVVKADAYGHGAVPVARHLEKLGADYLAVSNLEEAMQLRNAGIALPVLILGYTPCKFAGIMAENRIAQEVNSLEYARQLEHELAGGRARLTVHLKLDTGMTRLGFFAYDRPETLEELCEIAKMSHLYPEGAFTHFAAADSLAPEDAAFTRLQYARFTELLGQMESRGVRPEIRHCANSGATLLYPEYAMDMVRPGIATYGLAPAAELVGKFDLKPLLSLRTSVSQIRRVPAGRPVSYGRTYFTPEERTIAVLPIGYADGLLRSLSGRVQFLWEGRPVPQVGRICMDMCMADITGLPGVQIGDQMTLVGTDGGAENTWDALAALGGTISYELLCSISKRVPRIYWEEGRKVEYLDQLGVYDGGSFA